MARMGWLPTSSLLWDSGSTMGWRTYTARTLLTEGDNGDAVAALFGRRRGKLAYQGVVRQLLTDGLPQGPGAFAMEQSDEGHAGKVGVVEVAVELRKHLLDTPAP